MGDPTEIAVLVKVVALRVDVDSLSGVVTIDQSMLGVSLADQAALAVGRALAAAHGGEVVIYCVTAPAGERCLRALAAEGASRAVRLALVGDEQLAPEQWLAAYPSATVARALAPVVANSQFVVTGDHSLDRGSATVPARLAQRLNAPQALGLLDVDAENLTAHRRLNGGWREVVSFAQGTVLSVEASAGRPTRSSPGALRAADVDTLRVNEPLGGDDGAYAPYRAPTVIVAPPSEPVAARRAMEVIGATAPVRRREVLTLDPESAAKEILARLATWGYQ